jgi:hypothetical protein
MLTGAERKIGGKKGAFSAGQHGRPAGKRSLREGISAEKTPSKKGAFSAGQLARCFGLSKKI